MLLVPQGKNYVWQCDRCDNHNITRQTRLEHSALVCPACSKAFPSSSCLLLHNWQLN